MATNYNNQNYLFFNGGIEVDIIKIETNVDMTFTEAIAAKENRGTTTTLFNTFDRNMYANYVPPTPENALSTITIYRKTPEQNFFDFVCFLSEGRISFYDYNIRNNIHYHYMAAIPIPVNDSSQPDGIGMEYRMYENLNPDGSETYHHAYWKSWSITNIRESETVENTYEQYGYTWNLKLNIENENITQNTSVTSWDTLGKFPKISIGKKSYDSATFTGLLGDVAEYKRITEVYDNAGNVVDTFENIFSYTERFVYQLKNEATGEIQAINTLTGEVATYAEIKYANEMQKLQAWREFINDGSLKLLKDLKGNSWIVMVNENPAYEIDNKPHSAPTTISFSWQEVENVDNTAVVNME